MSCPRRAPGRLGEAVVILGLSLAACAPALTSHPPGLAHAAGFDFERDTLAFPNLVRAEQPGRPVVFANYCIVMARTTTQFFRFARFAPERPPLAAEGYARPVREVLAIDPWEPPRRHE